MINIIKYLIEAKNKKEEQKHIEGTSILDKILNNLESNVDNFVKEFIRPNGPTIYAFVTDKVN